MQRTAALVIVLVAMAALVVAACTPRRAAAPKAESTISSLAVLPVTVPPPDPQKDPDPTLATGRRVMAEALEELLTARGLRVLQIHPNTVETLTDPASGPAIARQIGQRFGADAVLAVELTRYRDRQGSTYAAVSPAAVSFSYRLLAADGSPLCNGTVEAEQQSSLANIFKFSFKRGFRWLSGPEFVRETLAKKFDSCPQLAGH